jgi:ABC-type nitrate/sulfonate/bicarbonate transport system substrate-binding protein
MKNLKNLFPIAIAILAIVIIVAYAYSVNKKRANTPKTKIKVASNYAELAEVGLLIDVAEKQGFFKKNNIEVEKVQSASAIETLIAKETDIAVAPVTAVVSAFYNNQDIKWVATTSNYAASNYAASRFTKDKLSEVKNVGIMKMGNAEQPVWPQILENYGNKDFNNLKFTALPDSKARLALIDKGELDITFIINYEALKAVKESGKYTVLTPQELFGDKVDMPRGIITRGTVINQNPDAVKGFVQAYHEATEYIVNNKQYTIETIKKDFKLDDDYANLMYDDAVKSRENLRFVPEAESIMSMVQFVKKNSKPKNPTRDLAELIYTEFAKAVK